MTKMPQHVAMILDGNRRWAREHQLDIFKGHQKVVEERLMELVDHAIKRKISYLTFWAFSTENWDRSPREIKYLMKLFRRLFDEYVSQLDQKGVRLNHIGDLTRFEPDLQKRVRRWVNKTKNNQKITVTIALNYGGHDEIVRAVKRLVADFQKHGQKITSLTESKFANYLDTHDLPNPDLIIRTSGEQRLSGFMSWQSAYAEFCFPKTLMPDFGAKEFDRALQEYAARDRRFGK